MPYVYTRWRNPTIRVLEEKLAALEGTEDCVAFASGMAATAAVMLTTLKAGDHLVISDVNYAGTAELARKILPGYGISCTPVDTTDLAAVEAAIRPETRMIWIETPANPILRLTDIAAVSPPSPSDTMPASWRWIPPSRRQSPPGRSNTVRTSSSTR